MGADDEIIDELENKVDDAVPKEHEVVVSELQDELREAKAANEALTVAKDASGQLLEELSESINKALTEAQASIDEVTGQANAAASQATNDMNAEKDAKVLEMAAIKEIADTALTETQKSIEAAKSQVGTAASETTDSLNATKDAAGKIRDEIANVKGVADATLAEAQEAVNTFHGNVEKYRSNMDGITKKFTEANDNKTRQLEDIRDRLQEFEKKAQDQLERVAGANLFESFNVRRKQIAKTKWIWIWLVFVTLLSIIGWTWFAVLASKTLDTVFFVKAGVTIPLGAVLVFWLKQFSRDRHTEEEYAFKGALSLSLSPYQGIIEQLAKTESLDGEYAKFLTDTIRQIYEPLRGVKEANREVSADNNSTEVLLQVADLLRNLPK